MSCLVGGLTGLELSNREARDAVVDPCGVDVPLAMHSVLERDDEFVLVGGAVEFELFGEEVWLDGWNPEALGL